MLSMILMVIIGTVGAVGTQAANMWARIFQQSEEHRLRRLTPPSASHGLFARM